MIELKHVRKQYPDVCPLEDVSTVINQGDVIAIIGPSGTGKSTLLRCINLLETPTSGQIFFKGTEITDPKCDIDSVRQHIGMVFQSYNLYEHRTIVENVMLAQTDILKKSREEAYNTSMQLLKKVGMESKALQYPKQLSGGQKQRAAIARTLGMNPEVILFDEPTSALDPLMTEEVEDVIKKLAKEGTTILIVTHSMKLAKSISNRVFYMDQGGIYEDGPSEQVFGNPQKERTRDFLLNEYHLKVKIPYGDFELENFFDEIAKFVTKYKLSGKTQYKMQLAFEEICIGRLHAAQKENEIIRADFFYDENTEDVLFNVAHNVSAFLGEYDSEPLARTLMSKTLTVMEYADIANDPDGALKELKTRVIK